MTAKRPIVTGELSGSDLLNLKELPDATNLEIPPQTSIFDERGKDIIESARGDVHNSRELLTCETEYTGADYVIVDPEVTWKTLPVARVVYPRLLRAASVHWDITGQYFKDDVGTSTFEWELMVDGVASGAVMSWSTGALAPLISLAFFQATLRAVHGDVGDSTPNLTLYALEGRLTLLKDDGAVLLDSTRWVRPTMTGTADRTLGFRVRRAAVGGGDALLLRSFLAWQPAYRSGV